MRAPRSDGVLIERSGESGSRAARARGPDREPPRSLGSKPGTSRAPLTILTGNALFLQWGGWLACGSPERATSLDGALTWRTSVPVARVMSFAA
jgi:hypothetical protein